MNARVSIAIAITAVCLGTGCKSTGVQRSSAVRELSTHLTFLDAIRIAETTAKAAGLKLSDYEKPDPSYNGYREEWSVWFQGKALEPGGFFSVRVNDRTGEAELIRGM